MNGVLGIPVYKKRELERFPVYKKREQERLGYSETSLLCAHVCVCVYVHVYINV